MILVHPPATALPSSQFKHVAVLLPANLVTSSLLTLLEPSLAAGGSFEVRGDAADHEELLGELTLVGLSGANKSGNSVRGRVSCVPVTRSTDESFAARSSPSSLP